MRLLSFVRYTSAQSFSAPGEGVRMNDKEQELLAQFHHTISEQLNSRLFHEKAGQVKVVLAVSARKLIADQREALDIAFLAQCIIAESPRFHPHSLWSDCSGASWCPQFNSAGAAISESNCTASAFRGVRSLPTPQSPELDDLQ
jgi:hypothetical protein